MQESSVPMSKSYNSKTTTTRQESSQAALNTPLHFDSFIPWICLQWSIEVLVTVVRVEEESALKSKPDLKTNLFEISKIINFKESDSDFNSDARRTIEMRAIYVKPNLVEVAIVGCKLKIPPKVIRAINVCLPFHPALSRLTFRKGGLTCDTVREISKLLVHTNITNICLDDSYVPEGNYEVLLDTAGQLTYLSLNRCRINDKVCEKIAMRLLNGSPGANTLRALELASNDITDEGAHFLGQMIRKNRILLHLNLADNNITDDGATKLISYLKEFPLTDNETMTVKRKRYAILKQKLENTITECEEKKRNPEGVTKTRAQSPALNITSTKQSMKSLKIKTKEQMSMYAIVTPSPNTNNLAQNIEEILDCFSPTNLVTRNGAYYAKGNFILCSLNLAYNDLNYPFLPILHDTLVYQKETVLIPPFTGIIRIVLEGNKLPARCEELDKIETLLKDKVTQHQYTSKIDVKKRTLSRKSKVVSDHIII